jgi:hypothetical protein
MTLHGLKLCPLGPWRLGRTAILPVPPQRSLSMSGYGCNSIGSCDVKFIIFDGHLRICVLVSLLKSRALLMVSLGDNTPDGLCRSGSPVKLEDYLGSNLDTSSNFPWGRCVTTRPLY